MNKKSVLKQLDELEVFADTSRNLVIDEAWKSQLKQIIIDYVSNDSPFLNQIDLLNFSGSNKEKMTHDKFIEYYNQNKRNGGQIIFRVRNHIIANGIKSKGNFITKMSQDWAIFWLSVIIITWGGFCGYVGSYFTQNKIDTEKIKMENKIDSLVKVTHTLVVPTNKATNSKTTKSVDK